MQSPGSVSSSPSGASYTAPAGPPPQAAAPTNCESARIEKAANGGFSVSVTPMPDKSAKSNDGPTYQSPETHVFSTFEEVVPFLASCFGSTPAAPASDVEADTSEQA